MKKHPHDVIVNSWKVLALLMIAGCGSQELEPVDIYPEDACAQCRMAVSDKSFASEIITEENEALKFDDLGCLETYRKKNPEAKIRGIFVSDFDTRTWLPYEKSHIVKTGITTPMGSGKVAFADSTRAADFLKENPPSETSENNGGGCCSERSMSANLP